MRSRLLGTVAATALCSLIWLIADAAGAALSVPQPGGSTTEVGLPSVIVAATLAVLAGWALLAALERRFANGMRTWTVVATAVAVLSLVPVLTSGATPGTTIALTLIHGAAAVIIPVFRSGSIRSGAKM